jgi:hypothetical protein
MTDLFVWCGEHATLSKNWNPACYSVDKINKRINPLGDLSDGGTPGYISNPEVKAVSADGTWGATPWESRSLPRGFFYLIPFILFRVVSIYLKGYNSIVRPVSRGFDLSDRRIMRLFG